MTEAQFDTLEGYILQLKTLKHLIDINFDPKLKDNMADIKLKEAMEEIASAATNIRIAVDSEKYPIKGFADGFK